jgi:hypothetical protein
MDERHVGCIEAVADSRTLLGVECGVDLEGFCAKRGLSRSQQQTLQRALRFVVRLLQPFDSVAAADMGNVVWKSLDHKRLVEQPGGRRFIERDLEGSPAPLGHDSANVVSVRSAYSPSLRL